jgi:hypothetical protein
VSFLNAWKKDPFWKSPLEKIMLHLAYLLLILIQFGAGKFNSKTDLEN